MAGLDSILQDRLLRLEQAGVRRRLRPLEAAPGVVVTDSAGARLRNFSSNDYLGLATHPAVRAAAADALREHGAGATASRLICGSLPPHRDLEQALARFKDTEAALAFSSGFAAALGVIPALVGPGDFVVLDRLAHACLVDGARLSGARLRVFRHNDPADLERLLAWVDRQRKPGADAESGRVLIVTESVFSMDGDRAPLREIVEAKRRHQAWLLVDEAHGTGVLGPGRRGGIEELGLRCGTDVEVTFGTLGKALGAGGGFVAGSAVLADYLVNRARSFVFSTAPPPATAAAARAALEVVASAEGGERAARLWSRVHDLHAGLRAQGWELPPPASAILPLHVGAEDAAMRLSAALRDEGFLVPGIRYPTVPRGRARLRLTLSADHEPGDVGDLLAALERAAGRSGVRPA